MLLFPRKGGNKLKNTKEIISKNTEAMITFLLPTNFPIGLRQLYDIVSDFIK